MKILTKAFLISIILLSSIFAQDKGNGMDLNSSGTYSAFKFRNIGPAIASGRISDFAVNLNNRAEYFVAVASGGVWKTTNSGTTWDPVFDSQKSYSIGCIALDPNNSNIVWVGSGENNSQRSVSYGDGIYLSLDGGKSWENKGLQNSEHIGKILVNPNDSKIVYVAAQGPLWNPGGDRGLYKSTDLGETWENVLNISPNTGVTDIVFDPENSDIIYAASYQRRRHVFTLINGGPESAIYKSTDAGNSWKKLTSGLPGGDKGRIGLAISPAQPHYIYAIVEAANNRGGFFRSEDGGESWTKQNKYIANSPQYYQEIVCDPIDPLKVYSLDTRTKITLDGGKTWNSLSNRGRHVDDHALWIDPNHPDYLLIGGDGGVYESYDGGNTWKHMENLPITQFYRVSVDNDYPFYHVYGGTQDNNSLGGPSQTNSRRGIANSDWEVTQGGDGFESVIDPLNPNIVYAQSQYGWVVRYNKLTGEKVGIKPMEREGEEPYRWNWDSPLIISPHKNSRLYFVANKVFKSDDMGNNWEVISDDLSRKIDRNKLTIMGKVWSVDAVSKNKSTSIYGNIVSLAESPVVEGMIFAGTDDGAINITLDDGKNWETFTQFDDVPDTSYVSCILPSLHDKNIVYASFDNHKRGDFNPYILMSEDGGKTWNSIANNLPENGTVYTIAEDHVNSNLIFCGTEFGLFFSTDKGENWIQLKAGLPSIAIRDIDIQRRADDLVLASFGRGFYILDNYAPLRNISTDLLKKEAYIFPVKTANIFVSTSTGTGSQGTDFYFADNPEYGAVFTYFIEESVESLKSQRKQKEKMHTEDNSEIYYPTYEELKAEDLEENPYLLFTIFDEDSNIVRQLTAPVSKGIHKIVWDLKYSSPFPAGKSLGNRGGINALPGKYFVSISKYKEGKISQLTEKAPFKIKLLIDNEKEISEREQLFVFQKKLDSLFRKMFGVDRELNAAIEKIPNLKTAAKSGMGNSNNLLSEIREVELQLLEMKTKLDGDQTLGSRSESIPPSISDRLNTIYWDQSQMISPPTGTQISSMEIASDSLADVEKMLKYILDVELKKIDNSLNKLGAPYTPGRIPN